MQAWKQAEKDFEDSFDQYGKDAHVCRLSDTATAKATGGKRAFIAAQPSDYIVTLKGETFFAEVKSTVDDGAFHFNNVRKQQMAASRRTAKAGGTYLFFIKSLYHMQWYCVPAQVVHETIKSGKKHLTWSQMEPFKYDI